MTPNRNTSHNPDHPELRQSQWQEAGRYVVRWVWERDASSWRCDRISLRERLDERADAIIDNRPLTTAELAYATTLAHDMGWC